MRPFIPTALSLWETLPVASSCAGIRLLVLGPGRFSRIARAGMPAPWAESVKRACITVGLALAACVLGVAAAAESNERTIKDLGSHPVPVKKDTKVDSSTSSSASKAMENYKRFLELQKTDPQLRAEALRRLGDLNLDAGEVERMEKEVTAVDLQGGEAIKLYATLLKAYPDYARNDQVLYQLARAYETTGQPEQALATLDRVAPGD